MERQTLKDIVNEGGLKQHLKKLWNNNYIKTAAVGATLMLGGFGANTVNYATMPTNDTYKKVVSLQNEINSAFDTGEITYNSNKEEVLQDITSYFSAIEEKQSRIEGLVNTPEYTNVLEARRNRAEFKKFAETGSNIGIAIALLGLTGGNIVNKYSKNNYGVQNESEK